MFALVAGGVTTYTGYDKAGNVTDYSYYQPTVVQGTAAYGATYHVNYLKKDGYLEQSTTGTPIVFGYVPATVFVPQPKVESALVEITRRAQPAVSDVQPTALFELVKAGFAHRRQMLRRVLDGIVSAEQFAAAGIAPTSRAEELDVHAWGRLALVLAAAQPLDAVS